MKILAFSDLHRDRDQAQRLVELANEADVVFGAGDFASVRLGINCAIEPLSAIEKPTVLVPGNNESEAELAEACDGWTSALLLHGDSTQIDDVTFFGLGGGVPVTPFPWSFDLSARGGGKTRRLSGGLRPRRALTAQGLCRRIAGTAHGK